MLTKKANGAVSRPRMTQALASVVGSPVDRRTFLARSGLMAGGAACDGDAGRGPQGEAQGRGRQRGQDRQVGLHPLLRSAAR